MRFVTFEKDRSFRAGVADGDSIYDLAHPSMTPALQGLPPDVFGFVRNGLGTIAKAIGAHGLRPEARLSPDDVTLLAPIPVPNRLFGAAHNYKCAIADGLLPGNDTSLIKRSRLFPTH